MRIEDLGYEQKLALVALLKLFALQDNAIGEGEQNEIDRVAAAFGDVPYRELLEEVDRRFEDESRLREFLTTIRERGARELIYGMVMEESMSAPSLHPRTDLLDWLRGAWEIVVDETESGSRPC